MKPVYLLKITAMACLLAMFTGCDISQNDKTSSSASPDMEDQERENPQARLEAEFNMLKNPTTGRIPKGIRKAEMKAAHSTPTFPMSLIGTDKALPAITITSRGPDNYGGRTRAIGIDFRNSNIVIAGGVSSGIMRSADGGATWARVTPPGEIHNLTTIAQDPRIANADTWYAGTGESYGNSTSAPEDGPYLGHGVLKSIDNGLTWAPLTFTRTGNDLDLLDTDFDYIGKILVGPSGNVLVNGGEVLYNSTNGGSTFTKVLGVGTTNGQAGDIIYNASSSLFYASINGAAASGGIHSSPDGITWTQVRTPTQLNTNGVLRIVLTNLGASSGIATFYQFNLPSACSSGGFTEAGLQTLSSPGGTWTDHTDMVGICNTGTSPKEIDIQSGYNMCIASKPNNPDSIFIGGVKVYHYNLATGAQKFIGGSQILPTETNLHVDNHILVFDPNNSNIMWAGNDGGVRSTDVTSTINSDGYMWSSKNNGYVTYQYYWADISPATGSSFLAGAAQDNGITIQPTDGEALEITSGDGVCVGVISGTDFETYSVVTSTQNGSLRRFDDDFPSDNITPEDQTQGFRARFHLDADNTDFLYYPNDAGALFRTRIATTINDVTITEDADTGWETMDGVDVGSAISTFETTRNGSYTASDATRKLYIGTEDGKVYRIDDPAYGTSTAVNITPSGVFGFVSDIAINPTNDKEILLTYSNYGIVSIYHTIDASVASPTWTAVEGASGTAVALSSVRSALIVRAGTQTIYLVGTSTGLYGTDALSGGTTVWERIGEATTATRSAGGVALPDQIGYAVSAFMRLRPSDNKAVLGTHGNGLFELSFPAAILPVEFLSFTGAPAGKGNMLNWATAEEVDNSGFDVERSDDGQSFERVAFVPANQSRSGQHNYEFFDTPLTSEVTYYRLKQIDFDGTYAYSENISVRNGTGLETGISIFPNPVFNNLTVVNAEGVATIFSATGQHITQVTITTSKQNIDVSDLPQGAYVLRIKKSNGEQVARKFTK